MYKIGEALAKKCSNIKDISTAQQSRGMLSLQYCRNLQDPLKPTLSHLWFAVLDLSCI